MKGKTTSEQECLVKTRDDLAVNEFDEDAGNYSDKQLASGKFLFASWWNGKYVTDF